MAKPNERLHNWGITLSSLGGLVVILNMTTWANSEWESALAALAVVLVFLGIYLVNKAKGEKNADV